MHAVMKMAGQWNFVIWLVKSSKLTYSANMLRYLFKDSLQNSSGKKDAKVSNFTKLISLWQIWLKVMEVWWNCVKSAILLLHFVSEHKLVSDVCLCTFTLYKLLWQVLFQCQKIFHANMCFLSQTKRIGSLCK